MARLKRNRHVERDYETTGQFLDRVIITKVVDGRLWRFSSKERPFKLEAFGKSGKREQSLAADRLSYLLAKRFGIDEDKVIAALSYLG